MPAGRLTTWTLEVIQPLLEEYITRGIEGKMAFLSVEDFCARNRIHKDTLYTKAKEHPEISDALNEIKNLQAAMLMQNGLTEFYNAGMAKFLLSANHGMSEKTKSELSGPEGTPLFGVKQMLDEPQA